MDYQQHGAVLPTNLEHVLVKVWIQIHVVLHLVLVAHGLCIIMVASMPAVKLSGSLDCLLELRQVKNLTKYFIIPVNYSGKCL